MKLKVTATYDFEIEVDENAFTVKEYTGIDELVDDLAAYRFDILPVLRDGVTITDVSLVESTYENIN